MLIEEEHIVHLSKNREHFKKLGFEIPNTFIEGFRLKIKSSELPLGSERKIKYSCDYCKNIFTTQYKNYNSKFNKSFKLRVDVKDCCFKCARDIYHVKKDLNHFLEKSKIHHKEYYNYSKVQYIGVDHKVKIICPIHGEFQQRAEDHMCGKGCNLCKVPSKGEKYIKEYLDNKNISYFYNHKFKDCKYILPLRFDFYIPLKNLIIEFDGRQHTKVTKFYGGEEALRTTQIRDNIKNEYCKNNKITLLRISYKDYNKIEKILNNIIWE